MKVIKQAAQPVVYRLADIKRGAREARGRAWEDKMRARWEYNDFKYREALNREAPQQTFYNFRVRDKFPLHLADLEEERIYLASVVYAPTSTSRTRAFQGYEIRHGWKNLRLVQLEPFTDAARRTRFDAALRENRYYRVMLPSGRYILLQRVAPKYKNKTVRELNDLLGW
jgi:hypothetical protein